MKTRHHPPPPPPPLSESSSSRSQGRTTTTNTERSCSSTNSRQSHQNHDASSEYYYHPTTSSAGPAAAATTATTPSSRGGSRWRKHGTSSSAILTVCSTTIALALLGMGIKLSIKYADTPLIHISVAVVVFTAVASIVWSLFECLLAAACACCFLRNNSSSNNSGSGSGDEDEGIGSGRGPSRGRGRSKRRYPGAHVGVHMCLCLACVAAVGYVCIWVSHGYQWSYVEFEFEQEEAKKGRKDSAAVEVEGLYRMGIVVVVLTSMLLLIHFVQAMLACQEIRRKEDVSEVERIPVVTVRYDGVGPVGTDRPTGGWRVGGTAQQENIILPVYREPFAVPGGLGRGGLRRSNDRGMSPISPPVVIARGDLGVEIVESPSSENISRVMTPPPVLEKPSRSGAGSEKTFVN